MKFIKKSFKIVIPFVCGMIVSGIGVFAATTYAISSNKVSYTDNSGLGASNVQAAIDGTCASFNEKLTSSHTPVLLNSTLTYSNTTEATANYISIPTMNNYQMLVYRVVVANISQFVVCVKGNSTNQYILDATSSTATIRGSFSCDWANKRIAIAYLDSRGFTYKNVFVDYVYGIK